MEETNEKNELNDIILNKGGSSNNNKKIILAVATLGVILIIVVMLMNSFTSSGTDNLPQAALPPKPKVKTTPQVKDEPLFEEVEVVEESSENSDNLDAIAKKLKEESKEEMEAVGEPIVEPKPVATPKPKVTTPVKPKTVVATKPKVKTPTKTKVSTPKPKPVAKATSNITYYIQVGSFSKYEPNKKFLQSITDLGYKYKYHKVTKGSTTLNKVLVGPFSTTSEAKDARHILRTRVEPGAFLVKL